MGSAGTAPSATTPWIRTPLLESAYLSEIAGCKILLKLENLQPSGSFKLRGIGDYVSEHFSRAPDPNAVHFFSSSGGNAGLACVYAANAVGRPATVVVPLSAAATTIQKLRNAGATDVQQVGASWKEADAYLREEVMAGFEALGGGRKAVYVPPFDHELLWKGHSHMIDEIREDMQRMGLQKPPVSIVCSVGGGGLFSGVATGVERQAGWGQTCVLAVETKGADSLAQSLAAGKNTTLSGITSKATSLGSVRVCDRAFELASKRQLSGRVRSVVLDDEDAFQGCWELADAHRLLVEPACGVSMAMAFDGRLEKALQRKLSSDETVVLVVCGGCLVDAETVAGWKREHRAKTGATA